MVMRSILTGNVRTTAPAETSASRLTPSKADFPDCPTLPPFQRRLANVRFFNRAWRSSSLFQPSPSYRSCGSRFFSWSASRPKPAPPQALVGSGRGASLSDALTAQQTLTAWPRVPRPHGRKLQRELGSTIVLSGERLLFIAVHGAVGPHRVEHDSKLAGHRDDRTFAALGTG